MSQTIRSLAVEAGITVHDCSRQIRHAGLNAAVAALRLDAGSSSRGGAMAGK